MTTDYKCHGRDLTDEQVKDLKKRKYDWKQYDGWRCDEMPKLLIKFWCDGCWNYRKYEQELARKRKIRKLQKELKQLKGE